MLSVLILFPTPASQHMYTTPIRLFGTSPSEDRSLRKAVSKYSIEKHLVEAIVERSCGTVPPPAITVAVHVGEATHPERIALTLETLGCAVVVYHDVDWMTGELIGVEGTVPLILLFILVDGRSIAA